jgi:hypothetical protein
MRSNLQTTMLARGIETDQEALGLFWKVIFTRQLIWYRRFVQHKPPPWTKDPIFLQFKFTNMYRELDRGTMYLLDRIVNNGRTPVEQVFNIILYRMFNRIATYDHIGFQSIYTHKGVITWPAFRSTFDKLRAYANAGHPLYTDAHMVCAYEHFPGKDKLERFEYIFDRVLHNMQRLVAKVESEQSLGPIHKFLTTIPGIGPFNAYEIAVDISYCSWNDLNEDEWVNPGPGCQRGLKRIFPNMKPRYCTQAIFDIRDWQEDEWDRLNLPFKSVAYKGRHLTLRNVEHSLCEFFKYAKALDGTGRPRMRFNPVSLPGSLDYIRLEGK